MRGLGTARGVGSVGRSVLIAVVAILLLECADVRSWLLGCGVVSIEDLHLSIASSITFVPREALARVVELARRRVPELLPAHLAVDTTASSVCPFKYSCIIRPTVYKTHTHLQPW